MSDPEKEAEELFNKRDAKLADDTSVGGLHRYWQDRALEAESQLAAANAERDEWKNARQLELDQHVKAAEECNQLRAEMAKLQAVFNSLTAPNSQGYQGLLATGQVLIDNDAEIAQLKAQLKEAAK